MKKNIYLLITVYLLGCELKNIETNKKNTAIIEYIFIQGIKLDSSIFLKIYIPFTELKYIKKKTYIPLNQNKIDFLIAKNVLTKYSLYTSYQYQIYYLDSLTFTKNKTFQRETQSTVRYEILDINQKKIIANGFLFIVGFKYRFDKREGVYMSDTTKKSGWFTLDIPMNLNPHSQSKTYYKHIHIASLDERAKNICGDYRIFPEPLGTFIPVRYGKKEIIIKNPVFP